MNSNENKCCLGSMLVGARTLPELLEAKGIATRSKDATRGSWRYY